VSGSVDVTVSPERIEVQPEKGPVPISVSIYNATPIIDEFSVTLIGGGGWLAFEEQKVSLFPNKGTSRDIVVSITPGVAVPAGERLVLVRVTSVGNPDMQQSAQLVILVGAGDGGEELRLEPQVVNGGSVGRFQATVRNHGGGALQVVLSGEDPEGAVSFSFAPSAMTLPAFGEATSLLTVRAPRPYYGPDRTRQLTVRASGMETGLGAAAAFIQRARITSRELLVARIVLTLLGGALLIGSAFLAWADIPGGGGRSGLDWNYEVYWAQGLGQDSSHLVQPEPKLLPFASAGAVAIVLGGIGLLGLIAGDGGLTLGVGIFSLLLLVIFAVAPGILAHSLMLHRGFAAAVIGSVLLILGGFVGSLSTR
jgi:hypothetical protein